LRRGLDGEDAQALHATDLAMLREPEAVLATPAAESGKAGDGAGQADSEQGKT